MARAYKYVTKYTSPNQNARNAKISGITIHWWGNPTGQSPEGIVSWLCDKRAGTSAHYVVSEGTVWCIVDPDRRAWHAGNSKANHSQIGIELDPNQSRRAATEKTAAALIADLRAVYGNLPLSPHKRWTSTQCPGNWDLNRLDKLARGGSVSGGGTSAPAPSKPKTVKVAKLKVDARFGKSSAAALQAFLNENVKGAKLVLDGRPAEASWEVLQTFLGVEPVDGKIGWQSYRPKELGNAIVDRKTAWGYTGRGSKGSPTVRALQKWLGMPKKDQDGIWFESTSAALQRRLNDEAVGM